MISFKIFSINFAILCIRKANYFLSLCLICFMYRFCLNCVLLALQIDLEVKEHRRNVLVTIKKHDFRGWRKFTRLQLTEFKLGCMFRISIASEIMRIESISFICFCDSLHIFCYHCFIPLSTFADEISMSLSF